MHVVLRTFFRSYFRKLLDQQSHVQRWACIKVTASSHCQIRTTWWKFRPIFQRISIGTTGFFFFQTRNLVQAIMLHWIPVPRCSPIQIKLTGWVCMSQSCSYADFCSGTGWSVFDRTWRNEWCSTRMGQLILSESRPWKSWFIKKSKKWLGILNQFIFHFRKKLFSEASWTLLVPYDPFLVGSVFVPWSSALPH